MSAFVTFTCSNPTCSATHGITRTDYYRLGTHRPLENAGWSYERQPLETRHLWYCPRCVEGEPE